jgi:hypothetical protein
MQGCYDDVRRGTVGHFNLGRIPFGSVANAYSASFENPDFPASIRFAGWANVPSIKAVWGPGGTVVGFDMGQDATTRWSEWGTIVIKLAIDLCMC